VNKEAHIGDNTATEIQDHAPGVFDNPRSAVHNLLQHSLEPPALGRMARRGNGARQAELSEQTQTVVGERRQMQGRIAPDPDRS